MKKNCTTHRLIRTAIILTLSVSLSFQFGCSSRSAKDLNSDRAFNKFLHEIRKNPTSSLKQLSDIIKEKPDLEILGNVDPAFFKSYTTFTIAGSKTNMRSKKIDGLNLEDKYIGLVNYTHREKIEDFRKELVLLNAKATADHNLYLFNDFVPLLPKELNLLNPNLSNSIYMDKRMTLQRFSEKRARLQSPISTSTNQFLRSTFFFSPLGYKKNNPNNKTNEDNWVESAPVIPISVQRLVIAYNQVAWEAYHHLRRLKKPEEGELKSQSEAPAIEEMHFNDFLDYLERWDMRLLYPDPESANPEVRNLGIAFICQLLSWVENRYYQIFLTNPESPLIVDAIRSIKKFLSAKRSVLMPSNDLNAMLEATLNENVLNHPPSNFKFPNFYDVKELPAEFKLDEIENRMTFAYIPETKYIEALSNYNYQTMNKEVLTEYKKRKDEQKRLKELKRLRKKARRDRRKKRSSKSSDQNTEKTESVDQKKEVDNTSETKDSNSIKVELNASMISTFQLKEHIGLREYLAIPNNGLNKKDALSFAVSLLQKDVQESISRNLLKKVKGGDLRLANARRSIRMDNDPVVWIPKEFLKPKTGKGFKAPREFFKTSVYTTQVEAQKNFIPVLNYYYQRAISTLLKRRKF